ncbi:hypothetical protein GLAREA_12225 [Glarea lozoyensis ATCC 20868]|uniref:Chitin-binding type-1 domain-containing protein n=1 Tax=Glarea lozoyensis (strain ATCC 20868 / MF5171) TaxID=1116229 RepID=S3E0U4_GLAL2|nr:uncharacterized protein GLAREA_12225 [Glarea lozoyensis ATCC 20868]EPE32143.1 hypothetical protein GLAREA_12225 [Glarea lozoyensis ATCC 20868]
MSGLHLATVVAVPAFADQQQLGIVVLGGKTFFSDHGKPYAYQNLLNSQKTFSTACLTLNIPKVDGTCGSKVVLTCAGGAFDGNCCSSSGFCGTTSAFCATANEC